MKLYRLETVSWQDSQLLYHALPRLEREGLILLSPGSPYVCIGYFQDAEQEVDLEYCRQESIPVFRREVGGGAVYLDGEQLFWQLVIHKDNPLVPVGKEAFYRRFLQPPIEAYRSLGIPAEYKPVNDIVANGRKVSGTGVAEINDHVIFVGNLIVDFDYEMMARVLKVPDEKFRDKVHKTMYDNLSTIKRELGEAPPRDQLWDLMATKFAAVLGQLELVTTVDQEWRAETDRLSQQMVNDEWLRRGGRLQADRQVTIRSGVQLMQKAYKASGGLIRVMAEVQDGVIGELSISGDFFFYPASKLRDLEATLAGVPLEEMESTIARFYEENRVESPGVTPADLVQAMG
jgi:lipoate-protein ligase A